MGFVKIQVRSTLCIYLCDAWLFCFVLELDFHPRPHANKQKHTTLPTQSIQFFHGI